MERNHASPEPSPKTNHKDFATRVLIIIALVTAVVLLLALLYFAFQIFLVFFAAILFAVFLSSLSAWLSQHTPLSYGVSLVVMCLLLVGVLAGFFVLLAPQLSQQSQQMAEQFPSSLQQLRGQVQQLPFGEQLLARIPSPEELMKSQSGQGGKILQSAFSFFSSSLGVLANLLIVIVIGIYLAANPTYTTEGIVRLVPIRKRDRAREVLETLGFTLWGWLKGTFLAMAVIGTITTLGLSLIGVPLSLLLGVFAGLMEFVPNIGPFIAGLPAVLLALTQDPTKALYVIVLFVGIQSLEGYVLTPLVQKKVIDLPPILTIMAQVVLGLLAGFLGLFLATPLIAALMVLIKLLYIEDVLGDTSIEVKGEERAKESVKEEKQP